MCYRASKWERSPPTFWESPNDAKRLLRYPPRQVLPVYGLHRSVHKYHLHPKDNITTSSEFTYSSPALLKSSEQEVANVLRVLILHPTFQPYELVLLRASSCAP